MLCILCCKYADSCLKIFNEIELKLGIADIIGRHFWFKPLPEENITAVICSACWSKVDDFHQFYLSVEESQNTLNSKVKNEPFAEFDFNELLDPDLSPKKELTEKAYALVDKPLDHSNEILNEFCELEMPCSIRNEDTDGGSESINPIRELDDNEILNEVICKKQRKSTTTLKKTEKTLRSGTLCRKSKVSINVKKKVCKEDNTKKLTERSGVKSKLEDDAMVKKYIPMICELCPFVSEDYSSVTKHFRTDHPKVNPYVRCCNKKLFYRHDIVHHAYRHDNPEFFKCKECQKVFSEQSTLTRHMITAHTPEDKLNFHCDQCPKKFSKQEKLELHKNSHLPREERPFVCDQCPNSRFASNDLLKVHICMRHRNEPNVCHVCAKVIRDKASFEIHVLAHFEEGGPKLKCTVDDCDQWFKHMYYLRRHIRRVHTNEQKECEICGGLYKNKCSLAKHKRQVHSKAKFAKKLSNALFT